MSSIQATCPAHCILVCFIILTLLDDLYKLLSYLLYNILNCSLSSAFLGVDTFLNTLFLHGYSLPYLPEYQMVSQKNWRQIN